MVELCREFGVSRKTGYKIFDRYQNCGVEGLTDRSRRPYRYAHQLPFQVESSIFAPTLSEVGSKTRSRNKTYFVIAALQPSAAPRVATTLRYVAQSSLDIG
jgi:hypothetical protein